MIGAAHANKRRDAELDLQTRGATAIMQGTLTRRSVLFPAGAGGGRVEPARVAGASVGTPGGNCAETLLEFAAGRLDEITACAPWKLSCSCYLASRVVWCLHYRMHRMKHSHACHDASVADAAAGRRAWGGIRLPEPWTLGAWLWDAGIAEHAAGPSLYTCPGL